ncbi:hypothetical protein CDL15_Pgr003593 [Punica granatum]|nr:hypothetical protein CDL15_Pgr003593 [Punica granatum]
MKIPITSSNPSSPFSLPKFIVWLFAFISIAYFFYSLKFAFSPPPCIRPSEDVLSFSILRPHQKTLGQVPRLEIDKEKTGLQHLVFGIAASSRLWDRRKEYIKLWWKPQHMKGIVWLDLPVKNNTDRRLLPQLLISTNTSSFKYSNPRGHRSAIRISRIVSETLRAMRSRGQEDGMRWLVMGDDDTVFVPENLIRVLSKYDHSQMYYIGSSSESHLQNIYFSYNMAFGGGGFAISYPLARALERMQDRCIRRYPGLYGSDDRIQACMAELGVPLTREPGFHQYDVYGNLFGLLVSHPVTPLVSLHHIDVVEPIFPNMGRLQALQRLMSPMKLDSAGLLQQSICYDRTRSWTVSVSWGYAVQVLRGIYLPRDLEIPSRTFLHWYKRADQTGFSFNTRPVSRNPCQKPSVYFLSNALYNPGKNETASEYVRKWASDPNCKWKMADPSRIQRVEVYKKPDPNLWEKAPRRNCCRVMPTKKGNTMVINVGVCGEDEVVEL